MSDVEKVKKLREATGAGFKDCNLAKLQSLKPAPVASLSFFTFSTSLISLISPYHL